MEPRAFQDNHQASTAATWSDYTQAMAEILWASLQTNLGLFIAFTLF